MNIIENERRLYDSAWALPNYDDNSPGELCVPLFLEMAKPVGPRTVLDAGCGSGKGALALKARGLIVTMCDLVDVRREEARGLKFATACLWDPLPPQLPYMQGNSVDYVYCCDVMEHVPKAFSMLVVSRLLEISRFGAFFTISLMPDNFSPWAGGTLHKNVQTFVEWRDQLATVGRVRESRDLLRSAAFFVGPR